MQSRADSTRPDSRCWRRTRGRERDRAWPVTEGCHGEPLIQLRVVEVLEAELESLPPQARVLLVDVDVAQWPFVGNGVERVAVDQVREPDPILRQPAISSGLPFLPCQLKGTLMPRSLTIHRPVPREFAGSSGCGGAAGVAGTATLARVARGTLECRPGPVWSRRRRLRQPQWWRSEYGATSLMPCPPAPRLMKRLEDLPMPPSPSRQRGRRS